MLQKIRDVSHGVFTWVILGAVCVAFAFWGIQNYFMKSPQGQVFAKVNGKKITEKMVLDTYRELQKQRSAWISAGIVTQEQLKTMALQQLIQQQVMQHALAEQGFDISFDQVRNYLYQQPEFQVNGHYSAKQYSQIISRLPYSETEFFAQVRDGLLLEQLQSGLKGSAFTLPNEVKTATKLLNQTRHIGYATITPKQIDAKPTFTQADIQDYYDQHQQQFYTPDTVQLEYIELNADTLWKALPEAEKKNTNKEQWFSDKADQLARLSYENPNSLETAATQLGVPVKTTGYISRDGDAHPGITSHPQVLRAVFNDEVLQQGYNSDVISVTPNQQVVARVKEYKPSAVQPLNAVKADVETALRVRWQEKQMKALANTLVAQLRQGAQAKQVMRKHDITWETANITTTNNAASTAITGVAFMQAAPVNEKHPSVTSTQLPSGNYAVIAVFDITYDNDIAKDLTPEKVEQELTAQNQALTYNIYQHSQLEHAKVRQFVDL